MPNFRQELMFSCVIALVCILLAFIDVANVPPSPSGLHSRALVTAVDNSQVRVNLIVKTNAQYLTVKLLDGPFKNHEISVVNMLTGKMELDEFYETGKVILVEYQIMDEKVVNALARGYYRLKLEWVLIILFAGLLLAVAGTTGLKAALSFVFSAMVLWKLFFPLLLRGFAPISTGLMIVALLCAVISFSVGGITIRGLSTYIGSISGILLTCGLTVVFTHMFHLHGAVRPFAEMLLYSGYYDLNLTDIFISSVFLSCSGAVMDLAMDIAATMDEIMLHHPAIGFIGHMKSGLRVGRAVTGTMTTTLLLAYSGSHIAMFMVFLAKGLPASNLLNTPFVSAEVLNILVGSFGVVAVAPLTAAVSALLHNIDQKRKSAPVLREDQITGRR